MRTKNILQTICLATCISLPAYGLAFERAHQAHQHGHAKLMIAVENNQVMLELQAPAMDITGFQHQASTKEDKAQLMRAEKQLTQANMLFTFNAEAGCQVKGVSIKSELLEDHHDGHGEAHETHDGHHHADHHDEDQHSEFVVSYPVHCQSIDRLSKLSVDLFTQFPSLTAIEVHLITPDKQKLIRLNPGNTTVTF